MQQNISIYVRKVLINMKSNTLYYRFFKNSFWGMISTIFTRIISMAISILVARFLGADKFGAYGMVQSTLLMFGLLAGFSMGNTLTKYIAEYYNKDKNKTGRILNLVNTLALLSSALMMIIIISISSWLSENTLNYSDMKTYLRVGGILLFVTSLNNVQIGAIAGFENFKAIARINIYQSVITFILTIPLTYYYGVLGAIISIVISTLVSYCMAEIVLKDECKKHFINISRFDKESFKELSVIWKYSMPSVISSLCVIPAIWITNTMLVNQNNGYSHLGLFNAANQWRQLILFFPQILTSVTLPILSETYSRESREDFKRAFKINLRLTWSIALPITIFVIAFRGPISHLFGKQFDGMTNIMVLLMLTTLISIIGNPAGIAMQSIGHVWIHMLFNLGWGLSLVIVGEILMPLYYGIGLAISYLVATIFVFVVTVLYSEIKIMPKAYISEFLLMTITLFVVIIIIINTYFKLNSFILWVIIFIVSCLPFIKYSMKFTGLNYNYKNIK